MADDWKSPTFRQSVVAKIDETLRQVGNPTTKTSGEMETHIFQRATTKEDYLNFLARLLFHIKDLSSKQKATGATGTAVGNNNQQQNPQQQGGPDPINGLRSMACQNTAAPPQMMANDWKSPTFRQSVVAKIDEAIRQSGSPTSKTAGGMEAYFFQHSTTKEDYINFVARLLFHIKDLSDKHKAAGVVGAAVGGNTLQQNSQQQSDQDPTIAFNFSQLQLF